MTVEQNDNIMFRTGLNGTPNPKCINRMPKGTSIKSKGAQKNPNGANGSQPKGAVQSWNTRTFRIPTRPENQRLETDFLYGTALLNMMRSMVADF